MHSPRFKTLLGLTAALFSAAPAFAQITFEAGTNGASNGDEINISGATLFANFFSLPAGTNDFINANGNLIPCSGQPRAGFYDGDCDTFNDAVEQLAKPSIGSACPNYSTYWLVHSRGVGSGNGLREFVDFQLLGTLPTANPTEASYLNRKQWSTSTGQPTGGCTNCNGIDPWCQSSVDIAVMDVPTKWFIINGDASSNRWDRTPVTSGYGQYPRTSFNFLNIGTRANTLQTLVRGALTLNVDTAAANTNTVFDTQVAYVPVAIIANHGAGVPQTTFTELRHLFVTGRMTTGENFQVATRDSGSGTRNACMNSLGIDPSHAVGENLGPQLADAAKTYHSQRLGPNHYVSNTGGSGIMEEAVQSDRISIGYTGLSGPGRAKVDADGGLYEILDVKKDTAGGTSYVRPGLTAVLHNSNVNTGYQVGGSETFTTRGDPESGLAGNTNPAMSRSQPRDYLRNITHSIIAFDGMPDSNSNNFMPGATMAVNFFLNASLDAAPDALNPQLYADQTANTNAFSATVQNFIENVVAGATLSTPPAYGHDQGNNLTYGKVPVRNPLPLTDPNTNSTIYTYPGDVYGDGSGNGSYRDKDGNYTIVAGSPLKSRMAIQGDFNVSGSRDWNDIPQLMLAVHDSFLFEQIDAATNGTDYIVPEILGDFDGNGNFNKEDIRYFADGLAVHPTTRHLDRNKGFTDVDMNWFTLTGNANYFGTTLSPALHTYAFGDSRGDVAGNAAARGAQPLGADGKVDSKDIDYVLRNFGDWSNILQAQQIDLSADMNGDLIVNQADADVVVHTILCIEYGDANTDGQVNAADRAIVQASIATPPATPNWLNGDFNGDNVVDAADLAILDSHLGAYSACLPLQVGDVDGDHVINATDLQLFVNVLLGLDTDAGHVARSNINGIGGDDGDDIRAFIALYAPLH